MCCTALPLKASCDSSTLTARPTKQRPWGNAPSHCGNAEIYPRLAVQRLIRTCSSSQLPWVRQLMCVHHTDMDFGWRELLKIYSVCYSFRPPRVCSGHSHRHGGMDVFYSRGNRRRQAEKPTQKGSIINHTARSWQKHAEFEYNSSASC